jgi:hypothetical protein
MNKLLMAALLLAPAAAFAQSAFDGTWKTRMDSIKTTGKPDVYALEDGMYVCSSCVPQIKVKADGADQIVSGHPYYDTVAVVVVSPSSIEVTNKKGGKQVFSTTLEVSSDGNTLKGKYRDYTGTKVAGGSFSETRRAKGPAGSHAVSGSWQLDQVTDANDAARTVAYQMTDQQFSMHWNGQSYNAKFDGKQYPIHGDPGHTTVLLKRIDANNVEEIDSRQGQVTDEIHLAAAADGQTLSITDKDIQHDQITTATLEKQP